MVVANANDGRIAWVRQEDAPTDPAELNPLGLDRFSTSWQQGVGRSCRHRFGPSWVPLAEALDWSRTQSDVVCVGTAVGTFSAGKRRCGTETLLDEGAAAVIDASVRWADLPVSRWRVECELQLLPEDFVRAAQWCEDALTAAAEVVERLALDRRRHTVGAVLVLSAPSEGSAESMGRGRLLRAVTDHEDGLVDPYRYYLRSDAHPTTAA